MFLVFSPFCSWDFGTFLLSLLWILFQVGCLFCLHLFSLVGFHLARLSVTYYFVISFFIFWWVELYSCVTGCLAWGIQHWSLQVVGMSRALVLRLGPPGGLTPNNSPWHLMFSVSPAVWTWSSHHRSQAQPLAWEPRFHKLGGAAKKKKKREREKKEEYNKKE